VQPGHGWERRCVYVPIHNLLVAGALPAGSELAFGFAWLPGLAGALLCGSSNGVGVELDLHLGRRKSHTVSVSITYLLLVPNDGDFKAS